MEGIGQDQWLDLIEEAAHHSRQIAEELRSTKGQGVLYPERDEDTGENGRDGSPKSHAMQFLEEAKAQSPPIDAADVPSDGGDADLARLETDDGEFFPVPKSTLTRSGMMNKGPFIEQADADAQVARWKEIAKALGKTGKNATKGVISLYDDTGSSSQRFDDAGCTVNRSDIKHGSDIIRDQAFIFDRASEYIGMGFDIVGMLSACPCVTRFMVEWMRSRVIGASC